MNPIQYFEAIWNRCDKLTATRDKVIKEINKHRTVAWPDDREFVDAIKTRGMYQNAKITKYFLAEYDRSLEGDLPEEISWVEHVLPVTSTRSWDISFPRQHQQEFRHLLANLIPLSGKMNRELGNQTFKTKRKRYAKAKFESARAFAADYRRWTPVELTKRSSILARWAARRWEY